MKNIIVLLAIVSSFAFSQFGNINSYYLKGTPALGAVYAASTWDTTASFKLGNLRSVELRFKSLDSTRTVVSIWRKRDNQTAAAWTPMDSVTIFPASGAGADTAWVLKGTAVDIINNPGASYMFHIRFASTGNWASQAVAASYRVWLNYTGAP